MGIVYNYNKRKIGFGYKSKELWSPAISHSRAVKVASHPRAVKVLTPQNRQFLASLGLRLRR